MASIVFGQASLLIRVDDSNFPIYRYIAAVNLPSQMKFTAVKSFKLAGNKTLEAKMNAEIESQNASDCKTNDCGCCYAQYY